MESIGVYWSLLESHGSLLESIGVQWSPLDSHDTRGGRVKYCLILVEAGFVTGNAADGTSFWLSTILPMMAFRMHREDISHTMLSSENPLWVKKKWHKIYKKKEKAMNQETEAAKAAHQHHIVCQSATLAQGPSSIGVTTSIFPCNLVTLDNCFPIDSRLQRGLSKGRVLRKELHMVRWNACIPLFEMRTIKHAE